METRNLNIRNSVFEDCQYFASWEVSPEVTKYFSISSGQTYADTATKFVLQDNDDTMMLFTIMSKHTNKPIGRIVVSDINKEYDSLNIFRMYIANPEDRAKGYGTEALTSFLEYAFINMHMERVTIDYFADNDEFAHIYRRMGFKDEGTLRNGCKKDGKYYSLNKMSMLRTEFFENRNK